GCYLSHLGVYNKVLGGDSEIALIFEDDSIVPKNLYEIILQNLMVIPKDWDMINLSCSCIKCKDEIFYSIPERFFLMNCYLINKTGAKKMLDWLISNKIDKQIDSEISLMSINKIL